MWDIVIKVGIRTGFRDFCWNKMDLTIHPRCDIMNVTVGGIK
jgi:hypothetical protein